MTQKALCIEVEMRLWTKWIIQKPYFSHILKPNTSEVDMKEWKHNKSFTHKILSTFEKSKGYYLLYILVLFVHIYRVLYAKYLFFHNFFFFIFNHSSAYRRQQAFASATDRHFFRTRVFLYRFSFISFFLSFRIQR